jgi:hypothetical protein
VAVPKNLVSRNDGKPADELEGNIVSDESQALQSEASAVVLEEKGIIEGTQGTDLPSESVELTAITLHQPWASLIAKGWKQYETRDWPTNHRGLIVIHAGRKPKGKQELREHDKVVASFKDLLNEDCPYSSVIAIAQLTDVIYMTEEFIGQQSATELRCGNWAVGRYAFKLENVRAIAPIPAVGKQGLWKWNQVAAGFNSLHIYPLEPWNPTDFGKVQHKAGADGQLNLLEFDSNEPPEPDDYPGDLEAFKKAYLAWAELQEGTAEEEDQHITAEEICNQQSDNGNGSICAQELAQDSPTQELNCGDDRLTFSANEMNIAGKLSTSDSPADQSQQMLNEVIGDSLTQQILSPPHHPVNHSQPKENVSEPKTIETVSQQSLLQLESYNQNLQLSKTSLDFSTALIDQEAINCISPESLSIFPRAGTMQNGSVSAAQHFLLPGCEPESLLLRSPGALSSIGAGRPPGKNKLDYQLMNLGLLTNLEVTAPEFLEFSYNLPLGFSNPAETRTALELSQVQAQLSSNLELQAETEPTAIVESPSATPCIGQLPPSDSKELNISPALPVLDNIGSFSKDDLLNFAITAHESIAGIERSELELAMRKLNQARIAGTCLTEFKKRCRHGEFGESVSTVINLRTAQTYMSIAENWNLLAEASRETLLVDGQTLGINWARDTIAQSKKSLKSAAAPANPNANAQTKKSLKSAATPANPNAKHIAAATVPVVEEVQDPAVPTAITSVKQEQELMQKELGLRTNGRTLLPDVAVNDRANAERFDPHTVDDRPFVIQVESVEADDSKWYEETAIGVVSRTEGFTTSQSAEIINKLLKADFKSRIRATLTKLSKEELADLLRYCDQELDNRK